MRGQEGLLDVDFQPRNRIGRRRGVGKTFRGAFVIRIVVEFDEKAWDWQVEFQTVVCLPLQNLVRVDEQLIALRNHPRADYFCPFRERQDDAGRKGARGSHFAAKHDQHPWIIIFWPDRQAQAGYMQVCTGAFGALEDGFGSAGGGAWRSEGTNIRNGIPDLRRCKLRAKPAHGR